MRGRVDVLDAWERCAAWVSAGQQRALVAVVDGSAEQRQQLPPQIADLEEKAALAEAAAAMRLSSQAGRRRLDVARALTGHLARTWAALAAGELSYLHAMALSEGVEQLDPASAVAVESAVLDRARRGTVGQLRRAVRRAVLAVDPAGAEDRHAQALTSRHVELWDLEDGMAAIYAVLPADGALIVRTALDALAQRGRTAPSDGASGGDVADPDPPEGESRPVDDPGLDALRADALVEICRQVLDDPDLPRRQRQRPHIRVTVDLPTLLAGRAPRRARRVCSRARVPRPSSCRGRRLAPVGDRTRHRCAPQLRADHVRPAAASG